MKYKPKDTPHEMVRLAQGWESLLSQSPNPTAKRYISFVVEYLMDPVLKEAFVNGGTVIPGSSKEILFKGVLVTCYV